jgi:putative FmdB family regulatory protein
MPIHEYRCEACGYCFERRMPADDGETRLCCPACGKPSIRKRFPAIPVMLPAATAAAFSAPPARPAGR